MEKAIKILSYIIVALTITFLLTTYLAGNAANVGALYDTMGMLANVLLILVPLTCIVTFIIGMTIMLRTIMARQMRGVGRKVPGKLPMVHFIISIVCFGIYYIFVQTLFS